MIERSMHQVAVPPGTDKEIIDRITAKVEPLQKRLSNALKIKLVVSRLLHPLGMHFWVTWNSYDPATDRLLEMGLTCMFCPLGKTR